jgi:hypothetical protein
MNLFDLFEGAIDDLEARRIEDLEAKMDDLTARAKATDDPKVKLALRHEFAKVKAERDSYYKLNIDEVSRDVENIFRKVFSQLHVDGGGGNLSYILTLKAPTFDALRDRYHDDVEAILTQPSPKELAQAAEELKALYSQVEEDVDTNYTYTVFIDGTKEGTYGSKEEAKAAVKRKKEQAPGREYTIRPKSRTSMSSIKKFQRNRDRNLDEHGGGGVGPHQWHDYVKAHRTNEDDQDELIKVEGYATTVGPDMAPLDPATQWKIKVRQIIADYIKNPQGLFILAKRNGPNSPEAFAYNQIMHPTGKIALPPDAVTFEGWQDFNKVEPYAVCLAGKPVKKFDYYEEARRFHDNWKQKLYREGDTEKADKITLMPLNLDEAANLAQQAAIAIAKTKAHTKPKQMDEASDRVDPILIKALNRMPDGLNSHGEVLNAAYDAYAMELGRMRMKSEYGTTNAYIPQLMNLYKEKYGLDIKEDTGSWIVYDPETKQIRKRFKTHTAGKSYAKVHSLGFASSEYYFDNVKTVDEESMAQAARNPSGAKFGGYYKGTQKGPPKPGQSFGGMEEGIDGNMTVRSNPLSQPLRKRNYVAKNAQISGAGKHNNNLKAAAARGQVKHKAKAFELDEMTDDEGAKLRKDAEAYAIKQMTAPKKVEPKKSFMQQVGDKQIGMVKGAWKGLTGQLKESDNFMTWAVRNGYNFTKDPAIYESARKEYKALVESKKKTLKNNLKNEDCGPIAPHQTYYGAMDEGKSLGKRVKVVSGPAAGQTGTVGEVRNGAYQGAPKYFTIDLDNGGHVQVRKEALKLIKDDLEESLKDGEYFIWTVYFDNGTSKRIKVKSDEFDPYAYYARQNQVVVNVDYNWEIHQ